MTPARDAVVDSFSEFKFTLERQADVSTLVVKVNGTPVEAQTKEHANQRMTIWGTLDAPIVEKGTVLISALIQNAWAVCTGRLVYKVTISGTGAAAQPTSSADEASDPDATVEEEAK